MLLVTIGIGELMWTEEQAMSVTGHRSAEQMRRDYDCSGETTSRIWSGARTLPEPELFVQGILPNISTPFENVKVK